MYKLFFKRLIDLIAALIGLLLLSPIFIAVMIALFFVNQNGVGYPFS